ncbi:MAG: prolipoprotein diacylglyceryl transferase [Planctomycetes bacterium]|nr:prolipoprotein diacylglyceryl transferase [Planctomycetota bacterium]
MLPHIELPFITLPTYGLCMVVGTVLALALAVRWAGQRGVDRELVVELALVGLVCGLLGARVVFLVEQWDTMFADRPPGRLSPGPVEPLDPGDVLVLRTHAGEARVTFTGDEVDAPRAAARIDAEAGARDVETRVRARSRRGGDGMVTAIRGFVVRTRARGPDAWLEVVDGPAARKLGLQPGLTRGQAVPLTRVLDLTQGGLTYFGAAIGVVAGWIFWLRRRKADTLVVFDTVAPVLPLGLFFGRLGCLAQSCCWGREAGPGALIEVSYPRWSLPWLQMAEERLPCTFDPHLGKRELTPAMEAVLGPAGLLDGTPPLHATQLYEGVGVLVIAALLVAYRARLQTRVGQTFVLTLLLQAPLRFVVEHLRRDHDVFLQAFGYPLTETQVVALVIVLVAVPLFVWLARRGRPVARPAPAPAAPEAVAS